MNPTNGREQTTRAVTKSNPDTKIADVQQQSVEQFVTSSKQRDEFSSSVSYTSAAMSSMMATSKSESVVQSKQSQMVQESTSRTIQSFSQESSECQSTTVYQTQTCPPKSLANPSQSINPPINETTKKVQMIESKENMQSKLATEVKSVSVSQPPKAQDQVQVPQMTNTKAEPNIASAVQESVNTNQVEKHERDSEAKLQTKTEEVITNQQNSSLDTQIQSNDNRIEQPKLNAQPAATETLQAGTNCNAINQNVRGSLVDALTTAPDRPYSPLPTPPQPISIMGQTNSDEKTVQHDVPAASEIKDSAEISNMQLPTQPSPMFLQEKRSISPIPPIKTYNPPEKVAPPVPMPEETKPYIPPDFKIIIEPKEPREATSSPMIDALTIAPDRPFTPVAMTYAKNQLTDNEIYDQNQVTGRGSCDQNQSLGRGSLRDALTIAPDRPYSPFGTTSTSTTQSTQYMTSTISHVTETNISDIVKPIATQTLTQMTDQMHSEFSAMQNTCKLQSSSEMSAFRPVPKQVFPPPQPEEFCKLTNFPPISNELKTSFTQATKTKQETSFSESTMMQRSSLSTSVATQGYSSVKSAQNYFEQLDKKESLTSTAVRSKSGLHRPDSIPPYQRNFEQLPSQRGISPDMYNAPAVLQRPVTPSTAPPTRPKEKSVTPKPTYTTPQASTYPAPQAPTPKFQQVKTPVQQPPVQFHKDTPITMTFQPVTDENIMRISPARSRPTTPSLINKPAPIIPHYQMNLVTVEHLAPESHLYEPSSREGSRSPTPKPRSRSPAQGPPPNPLKAHAPRIKDSTPQNYTMEPFSSQDAANLRRQHERDQREFQTAAEIYNTSGSKNWGSMQPVVKEQRHSNVGYKSENYTKGDMKFKEDSMIQENYGQRQMQSQNVVEQGNTTVQTTRKTFEEFERTQSAKVIEIRKGGSSIPGAYAQNMDCNIRPSSINPKQVFPPPMMSLPSTQQSSSLNLTNQNMTSASRTIDNYDPKPSISGANQGPVCDPTPSTGSSVGAAARGKTFGVSSAPKRGRGVLNKAALPGSRVPLCASCNGHIRGPFITALGRIWCPEHFICVNATCRRPLQDIGFVEENGQLYCEFCFEQYIAPACDKCHAKIKGDCLNAIGKHYHPECFNCVYCGKLFGNNPFFLEDGLPYCEADWNDLFTTKCFACGFPVEAGDRWVEALNNNYHSQCFNCTVCKKNLEGQSFFAKGGRPFCKTHAR
ncbi:PDZ and LIM domain protein Zasp isoform X1 [Helicoverpa zea]|uniref:PDZ and LIM domain protein Zasp isoform X1 n=1 Tax=Helicoverpa zea TaxID=7113 RepID=UPI001F59EE79|nr:PDZ and LIM domain protein Zasp isoform X1 [Helicoverpa zea]